jgi:ribosomal protein S18 acetylase RimI-like enzyme
MFNVKYALNGFFKKLRCSRDNIILRPITCFASNEKFTSDENISKKKLNLSNFKMIEHEYLVDSYSIKKRVRRKYFVNDETIAHIDFSTQDGNIWSIHVDNNYRGKGLGTQILDSVIVDIKKNNVDEIYLLSRKNHEFWNNVYNGGFDYDKKRSIEFDKYGLGYFVLKLDNYTEGKKII